jgi:hypothetical protein
MSRHPDDDALFAGESGAKEHLASCEACSVRARRLAAGRSLIEATRRDSAPPMEWRDIDAKVMAEAERTAAEIRSGALRPSRRIGTALYAGAALAAAAAALFAWRMNVQRPTSVPMVAHAQPATPVSPAPVANPEVPPLVPSSVDGTVLMVVAPVGYTAPGGTEVPLAATTPVRQGSRIAVDDHGGRAVVALHSGYRLDARAGAEITVARLDTATTLLTLTKGEARIDGPRLDDERVALEASGWTLHAKGGAFVAKIDEHVIRLRVLSGKVGVARGGGPEQDIVAGDEVELAKEGPALRVVSHDARDPNELNMAFLATEGHVFAVPSLPGAAASDHTGVAVNGFGVLPAGVSSIRTHGPLTVHGQVGGESYTAELDGSASNAAWHRAPRPTAAHPTTAAPVSPTATQSSPQGSPPSAVATVATPPPSDATASPPRTRAELEQQLTARAAGCFDRCRSSSNCALHGSDYAYVAIDPDADGHVIDVRMNGFASSELNACVERVARSLRVPPHMIGTVQLHLQAPAQH